MSNKGARLCSAPNRSIASCRGTACAIPLPIISVFSVTDDRYVLPQIPPHLTTTTADLAKELKITPTVEHSSVHLLSYKTASNGRVEGSKLIFRDTTYLYPRCSIDHHKHYHRVREKVISASASFSTVGCILRVHYCFHAAFHKYNPSAMGKRVVWH